MLSVADALVERGAKGFLLSGGVDCRGGIPLADFVPSIRRIKSNTDLVINAHIGLTSPEEIEELVATGIDSFSVDLYGSDETIREVTGLNAKVDEYFSVVRELARSGARKIAPHICIGIHAGKLKGEFHAIENLRPLKPSTLILISLIPTKGTEYSSVRAPDSETISSVVRMAKHELPDTKIALGCMRSKKERAGEVALVEAGLDGIVLPSPTTVERLVSMGYEVKKRAVCCSML